MAEVQGTVTELYKKRGKLCAEGFSLACHSGWRQLRKLFFCRCSQNPELFGHQQQPGGAHGPLGHPHGPKLWHEEGARGRRVKGLNRRGSRRKVHILGQNSNLQHTLYLPHSLFMMCLKSLLPRSPSDYAVQLWKVMKASPLSAFAEPQLDILAHCT